MFTEFLICIRSSGLIFLTGTRSNEWGRWVCHFGCLTGFSSVEPNRLSVLVCRPPLFTCWGVRSRMAVNVLCWTRQLNGYDGAPPWDLWHFNLSSIGGWTAGSWGVSEVLASPWVCVSWPPWVRKTLSSLYSTFATALSRLCSLKVHRSREGSSCWN